MKPETVLVALLAAGRASRFGGGKLDAPCAGKPLGQWALDAVGHAGLCPGVVVTGPAPPDFIAGAEGWRHIVNPHPSRGLAGSVAAAARVARQSGSEALLILLADMPLVTPDMLRQLAAQPGAAAIRHGNGRAGVPALFPAALFDRLGQCEGDRGAATLLAELADLRLIEAPPGALTDVDTPDDLRRAEALLRERALS